MKTSSRLNLPLWLIAAVIATILPGAMLMLCTQSSRAASATWLVAPVNGSWNEADNWTAGGPPDGPFDNATFDLSSSTTAVYLTDNTEVNTLQFNEAASAFTITVTARILTLSGLGIQIAFDGIIQNFVTNDGSIWFTGAAVAGTNAVFTNKGSPSMGDHEGVTEFYGGSSALTVNFINEGGMANGGKGGGTGFHNNSRASGSVFFNNGSAVSGGFGGSTEFHDSSTASFGSFANNRGVASGGRGGSTVFRSASTAANGTFFNYGGAVSGAFGGSMLFADNSTASFGTFTNNGATVAGVNNGGYTVFADTSTAGSAILIANGGSSGGEGGQINFFNSSTGGTARVEVFGNGIMDIDQHNAPGVTIGSLEGSGYVYLGARNLSVGSNNLTTIFSGLMLEGGGGTGGALTKIGSGTLTLSGANTYTGNTTISAGMLLANNATGSALGSGPVTVNSSGVLGGTGTIGGPVTVNSGGALLGGNATTASGSLKVANNVTLNAGSIIELVLSGAGAHSTLTRTGGSWTFAPNQAFTFLNGGAQPGFYDNIITGLAGDPGGTATWTITNTGFAGTFAYDGAGNIDLNITSAPGTIWNFNPGSGDWNTAANWTPAVVPNSPSDTATFQLSNTTNVSLSQNTNVFGIIFDSGASPFTITTNPTRVFTISGAGMINNSGTTQNFVSAANSAARGQLAFRGGATAGSGIIYTNNPRTNPNGSTGGRTDFFDTANAGSAVFVNIGATVGGANGGRMLFNNNSSAANATFTSNAGTVSGALGSGVTFTDTSTAADATFIVNGGAFGDQFSWGFTQFLASSTAGNAALTANGGTAPGGLGGEVDVFETASASNSTLIANGGSGGGDGGIIFISDDSNGGTSRVEVFGNGNLDLSYHNAPGATIGSLEGSGSVFLGARNLTVDSNNLSTIFSGVIQDGGANGGTGGSFSKTGSGILTFQGGATNDYIGNTVSLGLVSGSIINLNFTGAPDTIRSLTVDGVAQVPGLYGSAASGAPHQLSEFAGPGTVQVTTLALQLTGAASRKTHGGAADFDIPLPLSGAPGVECRSSSGAHTLIFTFSNNVVSGNASVTAGTGSVSGSPTFAANTMTVNLGGVADVQQITVTLNGVTDSLSQVLPNTTVNANFLIGDTTGNKSVNASDIGQTKAQSGLTATAANFRQDVTVNGSINSSDIGLVKARSGQSVP